VSDDDKDESKQHDEGIISAEVVNREQTDSSEEISEWKAYLQKMKNGNNNNTSEGDDDDDTAASQLDTSDDAADDDDIVPGYILYTTNEGTKIWLLADHTDGTEYSDQDVKQLLASGLSPPDSSTFASFHMSKSAALSNISRVRAKAASVLSYEEALVRQQAAVARRREAIRRGNMEGRVEGGGLSVADRKKLLWDSSGKLTTSSVNKQKEEELIS
jgi:hypothetical protein